MSDLPDVDALLTTLTAALRTAVEDAGADQAAMIGIHTGGAWIARELHARLGLTLPLGTLDISFYRDDVGRAGMNPQVRPSTLPFTVEDRAVILVDDVLHTGRTVRAAMNEIFDYGRPASIRLAVLVDRGGRELPIAADAAALSLTLPTGERLKLRGPAPLKLVREREAA